MSTCLFFTFSNSLSFSYLKGACLLYSLLFLASCVFFCEKKETQIHVSLSVCLFACLSLCIFVYLFLCRCFMNNLFLFTFCIQFKVHDKCMANSNAPAIDLFTPQKCLLTEVNCIVCPYLHWIWLYHRHITI